MKSMKSLLWMCATLIIVAGCESLLGDGKESYDFFEEAETVAIEELDQGFYASVDEQNTVIKTQQQFEDFWASLHSNQNPLPDAPVVNFDTSMVLVSVMDTQRSGGYVVEITQAGLSEGTLGVKVKNESPGRNCFTSGVLTTPYHMVLTEKTDIPVEFFEEEVVVDCSD